MVRARLICEEEDCGRCRLRTIPGLRGGDEQVPLGRDLILSTGLVRAGGLEARVAKEKRVLMEVPERLAKVLERLVKADERGERMASGREPLDWGQLSAEIESAGAAAEREISRRQLRRLDERRKTIVVDGKTYRKVGRYEGTYYTKAGPVTLPRTLYRDASVRNGKTMDAISLKLGCVEDGWLPETADAMACLLQSVPGAEAEKLAKKLGRVTYSASSFKRVGSAVGHLYEAGRNDIEDALIAECVIPDTTRSLTVSIDRVALPMEIDVARKPGRPKKTAPKRSVARVYEMAWVGTVSLVDGKGEHPAHHPLWRDRHEEAGKPRATAREHAGRREGAAGATQELEGRGHRRRSEGHHRVARHPLL